MSFPDDPELQATLESAPAITYHGHGFRVMDGFHLIHNVTFEHLRAGTAAGRCNPPGVPRLYLGADKETAVAEFRHYAAKGGVDPDLAESYEFAVDLKLGRVLDLTSGSVRKGLKLTLAAIKAEWEPDPLRPPPPPTRLQMVGYWISQGHGNFVALLVPSARRHAGRNLVLFKDRSSAPDAVTPRTTHPTKTWP